MFDSGTRSSLDPYCHHQIIYCKVNFRIPPPSPLDRTIWHYNRAKSADIKRSLTNSLDTWMSTRTPRETTKRFDPPWTTESIKTSFKNRLFKNYKKTRERRRIGLIPFAWNINRLSILPNTTSSCKQYVYFEMRWKNETIQLIVVNYHHLIYLPIKTWSHWSIHCSEITSAHEFETWSHWSIHCSEITSAHEFETWSHWSIHCSEITSPHSCKQYVYFEMRWKNETIQLIVVNYHHLIYLPIKTWSHWSIHCSEITSAHEFETWSHWSIHCSEITSPHEFET